MFVYHEFFHQSGVLLTCGKHLYDRIISQGRIFRSIKLAKPYLLIAYTKARSVSQHVHVFRGFPSVSTIFLLEFGTLYCRLCSFVCLYVQFVCLFFCQILSCSIAFNFAYHYDFCMFISRLRRAVLDTMSCDRVLMFSWSRHLTKNKILNYIKQKYDVKRNKHTWS